VLLWQTLQALIVQQLHTTVAGVSAGMSCKQHHAVLVVGGAVVVGVGALGHCFEGL
jgi:hypothetical protein